MCGAFNSPRVTRCFFCEVERASGGFTLVEVMVVILSVGILSAAALPLYLGYTHDAKLAEAKALGGSILTALSGCAQVKGAGNNCVMSEIQTRIGLTSPQGFTYDNRWKVHTAQLSVSTDTPPILNGTISISGVAQNAANLVALSFFINASGVTLRCGTTGNNPPSTSMAGEAC